MDKRRLEWQLEYSDFDVEIGPSYRPDEGEIRVLSSPQGESHRVMVPFPSLPPLEGSASAEDIGTALFDGVFRGQVGTLFHISSNLARGPGQGLRIRLRIHGAEWAALPWELLYDPDERRFIAKSPTTPIIRHVTMTGPISPLDVAPPLRILAMAPSPQDLDPLDVAKERRIMEDALGKVVAEGAVELEWMDGQTIEDLQAQMSPGLCRWHVFHFVGHGSFDAEAGGQLWFADRQGNKLPVPADSIAELLSADSLRLVVLNACQGATSSPAFHGTATVIARRGAPAVIAMQRPVTDNAAIVFSQELYKYIAWGAPVEAAAAEARRAMARIPESIDWSAPVVYLRARDGVLFRLGDSGVADGRAKGLGVEAEPHPVPSPSTETAPPVDTAPPADGSPATPVEADSGSGWEDVEHALQAMLDAARPAQPASPADDISTEQAADVPAETDGDESWTALEREMQAILDAAAASPPTPAEVRPSAPAAPDPPVTVRSPPAIPVAPAMPVLDGVFVTGLTTRKIGSAAANAVWGTLTVADGEDGAAARLLGGEHYTFTKGARRMAVCSNYHWMKSLSASIQADIEQFKLQSPVSTPNSACPQTVHGEVVDVHFTVDPQTFAGGVFGDARTRRCLKVRNRRICIDSTDALRPMIDGMQLAITEPGWRAAELNLGMSIPLPAGWFAIETLSYKPTAQIASVTYKSRTPGPGMDQWLDRLQDAAQEAGGLAVLFDKPATHMGATAGRLVGYGGKGTAIPKSIFFRGATADRVVAFTILQPKSLTSAKVYYDWCHQR